mgnify:CR=1 FL=1
MKCKICGLGFSSLKSLAYHTKKNHFLSLMDYYIKYENLESEKCIICGKPAIIRRGIEFQKTCGSEECKSRVKKEIWSDEKRKIQSKIVSNSIKKHGWSNTYRGGESDPEIQFKKIISKYDLEVFQFYKDREFGRLFEIDFAIPSLKIGFEINGNQHYDGDGNLKKYYQDRHNIIESKGWKLIEIHYLKCYNNDYIESIISRSTKGGKIDYEKPILKGNKLTKKLSQKKLLKRKENKKTKEEWINKRMDIIINSDIDFSKLGWVNEVSKLLNISHTSVKKFMEKYMSDFYKEKCFKRVNSSIG